MAMIIDRSLTPLNSSRTMASSRRRDDNSRERVQNVHGDSSVDFRADASHDRRMLQLLIVIGRALS
jgi:hypothetical protein